MFCEDRNSPFKCPKLSDKAISRTTRTSEQMKMVLMKIEASEVQNKIQLQAAPKILNGPKNCAVLMSEQTKCAKNIKVLSKTISCLNRNANKLKAKLKLVILKFSD